MAKIDLTGQSFERWKVGEYVGYIKGNAMWECKCKCGTVRNVSARTLLNGQSRSCGCLKDEETGSRGKELYHHMHTPQARAKVLETHGAIDGTSCLALKRTSLKNNYSQRY